MKLTKEQIEELKKEREELVSQREELTRQANEQIAAMGGAIFYISQQIQENEKEEGEETE